jgi:hypothetical protein
VALPISALCAVLAVFCKQLFLPVPFALLVYLLIAGGRWPEMRYLLWLGAVGGVLLAATLYLAGPARLYHCLIWLPAHHRWGDASRLVTVINAARNFIRLSMPVPVLLSGCAVYLWASGRLRTGEVRALAANRCVPILLVGVALLPFSFAGRAIPAGDINSFSFALFFLTCGLTVMLADVARSVSARRLAILLLIATTIPLAISEEPLAFDIPSTIKRLPQAEQEIAFAYLKRHPDGAYFPRFPLPHYEAEHQFRHYIFGMADRRSYTAST